MNVETPETGASTLHAFYDFQLSPISFDFATFLLLARLKAQKHRCDRLHIVLVPGPMDGFRYDDAGYDLVSKRQRLHNIVVPLCSMTDLPTSIYLCAQRGEAEKIFAGIDGPVFPDGYSVSHPTASFLISGVTAAHSSGDAIPSLAATDFARRNAAKWLEHHCRGKRSVVITLREATYAQERNSDLSAWITFARRLDADRFMPILIRDSELVTMPLSDEFNGVLTCPIAAFDLHFRHALYELSYLNLMIPNGPAILCWLNKRIRFVMLKMITNGSHAANATYHTSMGLPIGGQAPFATPFQRLVWEPDTLEVIEREFTAMVERIGDAPVGVPAAPDPANTEAPLTVALRLQSTGRLEEASAIYQSIVQKDPNNADAWHLLGIIAHQADRPDVAERMIRRAIFLRPNQANYHINLAVVLRKAQRRDEAADSLWRAIALSPEDAGAHADLAELLHAQGANEKAKAALLTAMRLKPDSPELCERAARVLHTLGHTAEAADLYGRAIKLRKAHQKQARQARTHMSEIPVATLKAL